MQTIKKERKISTNISSLLVINKIEKWKSKRKSQQVGQPQSIFLRPVTDDEILEIIATLKNEKFVGKDGVDVRVLKNAAHIVGPYLKAAFNKCILNGVFPRSMKIAKVVPIFKAGEKN